MPFGCPRPLQVLAARDPAYMGDVFFEASSLILTFVSALVPCSS